MLSKLGEDLLMPNHLSWPESASVAEAASLSSLGLGEEEVVDAFELTDKPRVLEYGGVILLKLSVSIVAVLFV